MTKHLFIRAFFGAAIAMSCFSACSRSLGSRSERKDSTFDVNKTSRMAPVSLPGHPKAPHPSGMASVRAPARDVVVRSGRARARTPRGTTGSARIVAGGPTPNHGILQALCLHPGLRSVKSWGLAPIDAKSYVGVVEALVGDSGEAAFYVARIRKVPQGWTLEWMRRLETTQTPSTVESRGAASLFLKDYDGDGKKELMVRYRYHDRPEAALGSAQLTDVTIFNLSGSQPPTIAFFANLHKEYGADTPRSWRTRIFFKDLNGDGHPDILSDRKIWWMKETTGGKWRKVHRKRRVSFLWNARTDRFVPRK